MIEKNIIKVYLALKKHNLISYSSVDVKLTISLPNPKSQSWPTAFLLDVIIKIFFQVLEYSCIPCHIFFHVLSLTLKLTHFSLSVVF